MNPGVLLQMNGIAQDARLTSLRLLIFFELFGDSFGDVVHFILARISWLDVHAPHDHAGPAIDQKDRSFPMRAGRNSRRRSR